MALQARAVFQRYCFECHGQDGADEGGMHYVTDLSQLLARGKVNPSEPAKSRVLIRLRSADDPMPPVEKTGADRPDSKAIATIEAWIKVGAPAVVETVAAQEPPRSVVTTANVIATIHGHLARLEPEDRAYQRYFVLNHLHNQPPDRVPAAQLKSVRAATSKVLNSLSWRFEIAAPRPLDAAQTVLAIDTRDIDWDADASTGRPDLWLHLVSRYPYALKHDRYPDERGTRQMAEEIYNWTGIDIPWVRADWFVATASRPPLYHTLLYDAVFEDLARKPKVDVKLADGTISREPAMTAADLERWLRVNVAANLRRNRAARATEFFGLRGIRFRRRFPRRPNKSWPSWTTSSSKRSRSPVHPGRQQPGQRRSRPAAGVDPRARIAAERGRAEPSTAGGQWKIPDRRRSRRQ